MQKQSVSLASIGIVTILPKSWAIPTAISAITMLAIRASKKTAAMIGSNTNTPMQRRAVPDMFGNSI
jgi:hypothetical protein